MSFLSKCWHWPFLYAKYIIYIYEAIVSVVFVPILHWEDRFQEEQGWIECLKGFLENDVSDRRVKQLETEHGVNGVFPSQHLYQVCTSSDDWSLVVRSRGSDCNQKSTTHQLQCNFPLGGDGTRTDSRQSSPTAVTPPRSKVTLSRTQRSLCPYVSVRRTDLPLDGTKENIKNKGWRETHAQFLTSVE